MASPFLSADIESQCTEGANEHFNHRVLVFCWSPRTSVLLSVRGQICQAEVSCNGILPFDAPGSCIKGYLLFAALVTDGIKALLRGSPNMNTLVSMGAASAFAISAVRSSLLKGQPLAVVQSARGLALLE